MKRIGRKLTALLLSAWMLLFAVQPFLHASAAEVSASTAASFREIIHSAWENKLTTVSIRSLRLTLDQATDLYYDMLYTEAKWFYISSALSYSTYYSQTAGATCINSLLIEYNYNRREINKMEQELEDAISKILSGVQPGWNDAEKVLYLHEYLAEHCSYDLTYTKNDAYAALVGGSAVCQGYALGMCLLCRRLGIPCYPITSDSLMHMWNVVCVDGKWYQCDVTYDDGSPDMLGRATHEYVLASDEFMAADNNHKASDWNYFSEGKEIVCSSADYDNAFWKGSFETVQPLPDGSWYVAKATNPASIMFASQVGAEFRRCTIDGQVEKLGSIKAYWPTPEGNIYTICYITTYVYGDSVYYNTTDSIFKMPLTGGTAEHVYTLTSEEKELGYIYGMRIDNDGTLTYQIMQAPAFPNEDYLSYPITFHTLSLPQSGTLTETTTTEAVTTTVSTTTSSSAALTTATTAATTKETTTTAVTTTTKATTAKRTTTSRTTTTTTATTTVPTTTAETVTTSQTVTQAVTTPETALTTDTTLTDAVTTSTNGTEPLPVTQPETTAAVTTQTPAPTTAETQTVTTETTASQTSGSTVPVSRLKGDVNLDGSTDVSDAVMLARLVAEDSTVHISAQGLINAECTEDTTLNQMDVLWILRRIVRLV